jgi:hypothetical protein
LPWINNDELSQIRKDVQAASDRMIGLSLEEKVMIKRAMAREFMGSGHWYKCIKRVCLVQSESHNNFIEN